MQVPAIGYHQPTTRADRRFDPWAVAIVGGGVLLSVGVWALVIGTIVDLCGMH